MEKTDRELLIKEISTRLPYGVKARAYGWNEDKGEVEVPLKIYSINTDGYVRFEDNDYDVDYLYVTDCLLYLRPMSSMTEEEKVELIKYAIIGDGHIAGVEFVDWVQRKDVPEYLDWLNAHHFDYRGLIENGLAIKAPDDMYN